MSVKEKAITYVGHALDKLGEKERKSYKCAVCPFIGYQTKRPERMPSHCDVKAGDL